jgi:hypothetical protein
MDRTIMTQPASRASFTTNGMSPRLCGWLHIRAPDARKSVSAGAYHRQLRQRLQERCGSVGTMAARGAVATTLYTGPGLRQFVERSIE